MSFRAFNEAKWISTVVSGLRTAGYENICVVSDGRPDDTASLALRAGAHVLQHIANLGPKAALQTGIDYSLARGARAICTFDADGQHSPQAVMDLLEGLERSGADVALGSRFLRVGPSIPPLRKMLLRAALVFTKMHARVDVTDTHNGLRAFTRRAAEKIRIEQPQMAHASEILQKIGAESLSFVEVPVCVDYTTYSRKKGQSGFDSVKILLDLLYRSIALRR